MQIAGLNFKYKQKNNRHFSAVLPSAPLSLISIVLIYLVVFTVFSATVTVEEENISEHLVNSNSLFFKNPKKKKKIMIFFLKSTTLVESINVTVDQLPPP